MTELTLKPATLEGPTIALTPLSEADLPDVTAVALAHPELWTHIPYAMATAGDVRRAVERGLAGKARGLVMPYATRLRATGELVGSSSFFLVDPLVPSVEIGATWVLPRLQRTRVNTEAKRLMLGHAFDVLGCARVELKTDERNERSRAAILRIGAREEGTHRNHMRRADGSLRNSVYFALTLDEWPDVRERLDSRLRSTEASPVEARPGAQSG
jgi:N-acetyltransferase